MLVLIIFVCLLSTLEASVSKIFRSNIAEDGLLNFTQIATKYGHECEEFDVETEDGYILKLFHIKCGESKVPLLLTHGLLASADLYINRGPKSIAINLTDYDVWACNFRGNKYSRRHVSLSPDKNKKKFWDFSFHEMGIYDLPAIIDFILKKRDKEKLAVIGHSQGTSALFALGSIKPEYNKKISVFIALAPIAYLSHTGPAISKLLKAWPVIKRLLKLLGIEELLRDSSAATQLLKFICSRGTRTYNLCVKGLVAAIMGDDSEQLEQEFLHLILGHFPAGASVKCFTHYSQIANSARFALFDYGLIKNILVYKSTSPPVYDLSKVIMPVALVAAKNDYLSGIEDVERLKSQLANVVHYHVMEHEKFNHADYVAAKHLDVYVTPLLRDLLRKYA